MTIRRHIFLVILLLVTVAAGKEKSRFPKSFEECPEEDRITYLAAVAEFEPTTQLESGELGNAILMDNVNRLNELAEMAKLSDADIFVGPEYGVQSLEMQRENPVLMKEYSQRVPDPALGVVPCDEEEDLSYYEAVKALSCQARDLEMYLVIDLAEQDLCDEAVCPDDGLYYYNTQAVFDRQGRVIARYRKQNLYLEPQFQPGPMNDTLAIFDTDFGVRFTMQICFDITYEHPAYNNVLTEGINDVVMSTAWVDEVPFLLAINVQNAWTISMNANMIVSGYHWPEHTKLGSGIYRGFSDLGYQYTYDENSGDRVILSHVDTCRTSPLTRKPNALSKLEEGEIVQEKRGRKEVRDHVMLHEDLSVYNRTVLPVTAPGETVSITQCHDDNFCCTVEYEHSRSDLIYQFLTFSGILVKGGGTYRIYTQVCGVIWCNDDSWESCVLVDEPLPEEDQFGPFSIGAEFSCERVFPGTMNRNLDLVSNEFFEFDVEGIEQSVTSLIPIDSMMESVLFGRWYSRDP